MKITIEPTGENSDHPTITIAMNSDHLNISEVVYELIVPALVGWGFHTDSIRDHIPNPNE